MSTNKMKKRWRMLKALGTFSLYIKSYISSREYKGESGRQGKENIKPQTLPSQG